MALLCRGKGNREAELHWPQSIARTEQKKKRHHNIIDLAQPAVRYTIRYTRSIIHQSNYLQYAHLQWQGDFISPLICRSSLRFTVEASSNNFMWW